MIPLLLIQITGGAAAPGNDAAGLEYTMPLSRIHFAGVDRMHYTINVGRCHYDV